MMRVCVVTMSVHAEGGGTSTALLNTLAALRTQPDVSYTVYTDRPPTGDPAWQTINADEESGGGDGEGAARRFRWRLADGIGRGLTPGSLGRLVAADLRARGDAATGHSFDLVHIHGLWSADLLAAAKAAHAAGIPYVWEPHGMLVKDAFNTKRLKKELFLFMGLRKALRRAKKLVFITSGERQTSVFPCGSCRHNAAVVPLPVDFPPLPPRSELRARGRAKFGLAPDDQVIVFMGRLHPVKRIEMTLQAFARIAPANPRARLLLMGSGEEPYVASLKALAQRLGLADRVVFAGWVSGMDRWAGLAAAECLTLNSMFENFGYVLPEALAVGTGIVLTDNLALAQEVIAADAGIVVKPDDESLAAGLAKGLAYREGDPQLLLGERWVRLTFSLEAVGARLYTLYRDALTLHAGGC